MEDRGVFQDGTLALTREEAAVAIAELTRRNILHSQRTIEAGVQQVIDQRRQEEAEQRQKKSSLLIWGGVGLATVVTFFIALR